MAWSTHRLAARFVVCAALTACDDVVPQADPEEPWRARFGEVLAEDCQKQAEALLPMLKQPVSRVVAPPVVPASTS